MKTKKLPHKKYLRIHDEQFIEWITEIMSQEHMKHRKTQINGLDTIIYG